MKIEFECANCGTKQVNRWDDTAEPNAGKDGELYCDNCYRERFMFDCPMCEDLSHKEEETPENTFFYLHREEGNLKPGFYRVKCFPVFISDMFSVSIQEKNVELASNRIHHKYGKPVDFTEYICRDCFIKHTKQSA